MKSGSSSFTEDNDNKKQEADDDLKKAEEALFADGQLEVQERTIRLSVDKNAEFGKSVGLHQKIVKTERYQPKLILEKLIIEQEVVTDWSTGKTVRGNIEEVGPKKSKITWQMLAWLAQMVSGYNIPMDRLAKILSSEIKGFSSGRISSYISNIATMLAPIYVVLAELISEADKWNGDDTRSNVLEINTKIADESIGTEEEALTPLVEKISEVLPRVSKLKNGEGFKKQLSVSSLIGKSNPLDPRSTIFFFRTHVGDLGNLLSALLAMRRPSNKKLKIQTDELVANRPESLFEELFDIQYFGCAFHGRRPFYRYRERDPDLCFYMLRAFLLLNRIESLIDRCGRTRKNVKRIRQKYAKRVWDLILQKCNQAMESGKLYPEHTLYKACKYIERHYESLTKYIEHPEMDLSNNISERILRVEKIMLDSSKFRKTENGRVAIDIIRTVIMTCSAAKVPVIPYLTYVFKNHKQVAERPHDFTPYAYALKIDQDKRSKAS